MNQVQPPFDLKPNLRPAGAGWLLSIGLGFLSVVLLSSRKTEVFGVIALIVAGTILLDFLFSRIRAHRDFKKQLRELHQAIAIQNAQLLPRVATPKPDAMRMIFDRFDLLTIKRARNDGLDGRHTAELLDFAREFVDTSHAAMLLEQHEEEELQRHLAAALERALLSIETRPQG